MTSPAERSARTSASRGPQGTVRGGRSRPVQSWAWATGTRSASLWGSAWRPASCSRGCSRPGATDCSTSALGALAVGALAGLLVKGWIGLPGALVGGLIGAVSASLVARGALRRGATPGGTAFLVGSASIVVGLLALIPVVGYVLAVVVPATAARRVRQEPDRHAGLRTLAK